MISDLSRVSKNCIFNFSTFILSISFHIISQALQSISKVLSQRYASLKIHYLITIYDELCYENVDRNIIK